MKHRNHPSKPVLAAVLVIGGAALAANSYAGTATSNLTVSATVSPTCTLSTSDLGFGTYDPVSANASTDLDGTGKVTVTCTNGSGATITLGQGANADAASTESDPLRRMNGGGNHLSYSLYQNSARTAVWGNTEATGAAHTGTGTAVDITVYGRVAAAQNVPAGSYTDTVVATVTF